MFYPLQPVLKHGRRLLFSAIIFLSIGLVSYGPLNGQALASGVTDLAATTGEVTVFRSPTCGCCGLWVDHMQTAGFTIQDNVTADMDAVKAEYGIPDRLSSCHTAIVGDYLIEGHVPAADVIRLLAEQPDIAGITAPGMPKGSPGMEMGSSEPYTVFSFTDSGDMATFSNHL